jgi:hypothetical protein
MWGDTMVVKELRDEKALEFLKAPACPTCGKRVSFNGTGQAGIHRIICYHCEGCGTLYQLVIEKKGVPMFDEVEKEGRCTLAPDKKQNKCNVCACGLYTRADPFGD